MKNDIIQFDKYFSIGIKFHQTTFKMQKGDRKKSKLHTSSNQKINHRRFQRTNKSISSDYTPTFHQLINKNQIDRQKTKIKAFYQQIQNLNQRYKELQDKYLTQHQKKNLFQQKIQQEITRNQTLEKTINLFINKIIKIIIKIRKLHSNETNSSFISLPLFQYDQMIKKQSLESFCDDLINNLQKRVFEMSEENIELPQIKLQVDRLKWQNKLQYMQISSLNEQLQNFKKQYNSQRSKSKSLQKSQRNKQYKYTYQKLEQVYETIKKNSQQEDKYIIGSFKKIRKNLCQQRQSTDETSQRLAKESNAKLQKGETTIKSNGHF